MMPSYFRSEVSDVSDLDESFSSLTSSTRTPSVVVPSPPPVEPKMSAVKPLVELKPVNVTSSPETSPIKSNKFELPKLKPTQKPPLASLDSLRCVLLYVSFYFTNFIYLILFYFITFSQYFAYYYFLVNKIIINVWSFVP